MTALLAQFRDISESFNKYISSKAEWPVWLGIAFLIVVAVVAVRVLLPQLRRSRIADERFDLFARVHGLSRPDANALKKMGRARFPEDPALIFVSPTTFDAASPAARLDPARAAALRSRLFD